MFANTIVQSCRGMLALIRVAAESCSRLIPYPDPLNVQPQLVEVTH